MFFHAPEIIMSNLDAYFKRIAYDGPRTPSIHLLMAICAGHAANIPFENIDTLMGRTPDLSPEALRGKLLASRRGGYCFEHNTLLADVLRALGMEVTPLSARVVWMASADTPSPARLHMLLKVALPAAKDTPLIVDAGFGGQLIDAPLLLAPDVVQRTGMGMMRIIRDDDVHTVETKLPHGWAPMYRFTLEPHQAVDYEPLNWFVATHPLSIFRHNLLVQRVGAEGRISVLNDRYIRISPEGAQEERRIEDAADLERVLEQGFGITLPVSATELFARIPRHLDRFWLPPAAQDFSPNTHAA